LVCDDPALDTRITANDSEMNREVEERKWHRMSKVHDILEMWQGSRNTNATKKESPAQKKQMTAIGYISDTEEIVNEFWSLFHNDSVAAIKLLERSPQPLAMSPKEHPGGRTQILNVRRIRRIDCDSVKGDVNCEPENISDTKDWLNWNGEFDIPTDRDDNYAADFESDIEQHNGVEDTESPEQRDESAT